MFEFNVVKNLEKELETVEKNVLAYTDHEYDKDSKESVAREIELRSLVYTSLITLREAIKDASIKFEDVNKRHETLTYKANDYLRRAIEAGKKNKELTLEKERLEEKLTKLARVYNPDPLMIRVDGFGSDPDASRYNIRAAELYLNNVLKTKGLVTLHDVHKELGVGEHTNQMVSRFYGWKDITSDAIRFEVYKHETKNSFIVVVDDYYLL